MKKVILPGTFDPPTLGHLDMILRSAKLFDHVYVAIGQNSRKPVPGFRLEERVELLEKITASIPNVEVISYSGLLVDCAKELEVLMVVRSIRNTVDFEEEVIQAQMNKQLGGLETLYMMPDERYRLVSSSLIREVAAHGRRLHAFVPAEIEEVIFNRLK